LKKFSFSFERAMDWREKQAEQERHELQRLNAVRSSLEDRQVHVATVARETGSAIAVAPQVSGADLQRTAAYLTALRTSAQDLRALHAQCQTEIQTQTGRCVSADRDFKLLARLRDQRLAAWQYDYNRESELTATEVWQAGNNRNQSE
jgi:flagellar biosynthesis chaperone FliJ